MSSDVFLVNIPGNHGSLISWHIESLNPNHLQEVKSGSVKAVTQTSSVLLWPHAFTPDLYLSRRPTPFKLASQLYGFKNRQQLWKQELLDWWNFSDIYSLTSKPSTLHKTPLRCCQILRPFYLVRPLLLPRCCWCPVSVQSACPMQLSQATEQAETTIAHRALLPLWHFESQFVFICHNWAISFVWELRLARPVQQKAAAFLKDCLDLCVFCVVLFCLNPLLLIIVINGHNRLPFYERSCR